MLASGLSASVLEALVVAASLFLSLRLGAQVVYSQQRTLFLQEQQISVLVQLAWEELRAGRLSHRLEEVALYLLWRGQCPRASGGCSGTLLQVLALKVEPSAPYMTLSTYMCE